MCHEEAGKEIRNSILAILLFLVEDRDFCIQMQAGSLISLLMKVALSPDLEAPDKRYITEFAVQPDAASHEQQLLLWNILIVMCEKSSNCCREIMRLRFLDSVLLYVDIEQGTRKVLMLDSSSRVHECSAPSNAVWSSHSHLSARNLSQGNGFRRMTPVQRIRCWPLCSSRKTKFKDDMVVCSL